MDVFREDVTALLLYLRAFARSFTAGDRLLADDIVQATIVNALRAQHQFTPGTNLKAWLFTILRNRFKSVIARKHVTAEVGDDDLDQQHWVAPDQESRIEILAFKRAFNTLSRVHREVLVLAVVHGLPYERIAEICSCELGTVKSRVNRARAALKHMLLDEDVPATLAKAAKGKPGGDQRRAHPNIVDLDALRDWSRAKASVGVSAQTFGSTRFVSRRFSSGSVRAVWTAHPASSSRWPR
jgi:RNA polymerase sigma-70 factor, ECF subfamily